LWTKERIMPIYMKYGEVSGAVTEKSHKGWVELKTFEFGVGASRILKGPTTSVEKGKPVSEATITRQMDSTSTQFYREWEWGKSKNVTVDFVGDDGTVYLKVEMKDTIISGFSPGSTNGPIETLMLNFTKMIYTQPSSLKDQKHAAQLIELQKIQQRTRDPNPA
jgi:type VI protein secretion system component Hcp